MRVLIVEDEMILAMHLATLLADFGHEACGTARTADEGSIASHRAKTRHRPD
jgi:hypothetical protein